MRSSSTRINGATALIASTASAISRSMRSRVAPQPAVARWRARLRGLVRAVRRATRAHADGGARVTQSPPGARANARPRRAPGSTLRRHHSAPDTAACHAGIMGGSGLIDELVHQCRLADAGFAGHEDDLPLPLQRSLETAPHRRQLPLPTEDGQCGHCDDRPLDPSRRPPPASTVFPTKR